MWQEIALLSNDLDEVYARGRLICLSRFRPFVALEVQWDDDQKPQSLAKVTCRRSPGLERCEGIAKHCIPLRIIHVGSSAPGVSRLKEVSLP